jgi:hypothetical protein
MQKTAAWEKDDEVAVTVVEGGYMIKKELRVANIQYLKRSNKFIYQLKETEDSQTTYDRGRWFEESELKQP